MAQRRMFSQKIVGSDAFLEMPVSGRELYFQLGMYSDDDGFINPRKIIRMIGASDDDLRILITKRFVLPFDNGVVVMKHWRMHNSLRKDRYTETNYIEQKDMLAIKENGAYTEIKNLQLENNSGIDKIKKIDKPDWLKNRQKVKKESNLPYSFDYKIIRAFYGKICPVCGNEMRELPIEEMGYNSKSNPKPSIQHNKPLSKGGKHELGNISVICHSCNVSIRNTETDELNAKEVIEVWKSIGNQSAPQVRLGKDNYNISSDEPTKKIGMDSIETILNVKKDDKAPKYEWQDKAMKALEVLSGDTKLKKSSIFKCYKDDSRAAEFALSDCQELGKINILYFLKVYSERTKRT